MNLTTAAKVMELQRGRPHDRFGWMSTKDIFADLPEYPWLIKGLHIAPGRVTLLCGYADVGKTVVAQSMALAVASGRPVWGVYSVARRGVVLHLNGEVSSYLARERYQRIARTMGIDLADLIESGHLRLSNFPPLKLDDDALETELVRECQGAQMLILDSLRAFAGNVEEKDTKIGQALLMLARVSEATGVTIIVLHHNRKPQKDRVGGAKMDISGSGSIPGGAESIFVMYAEKGEPIKVEHERTPLGRKLDDFGLSIEDVEHEGDRRWGLGVYHLEAEQVSKRAEAVKAIVLQREIERASEAILVTLKKAGGVYRGSSKDLRSISRIGDAPFRAALASLMTAGTVVRSGSYREPEWLLKSQ